MIIFRMFARYKDDYEATVTYSACDCDEGEMLCMNEITDLTEKHGECTFYTCVNGYDNELGGYWVDGEWFDYYDDETEEYKKYH